MVSKAAEKAEFEKSVEKGLSSWRPTRAEIRGTWFDSGTEAQIGFGGKRGIGADLRLLTKQPRVGWAPQQEGGVKHQLTDLTISQHGFP